MQTSTEIGVRRGPIERLWSWLNHRAVGHTVQRALWWSPELQKRARRRSWALKARAGRLLVDASEIRPHMRSALAHLSRNGRTCIGDYLEFGVFTGTSMICMHQTLGELDLRQVRLFGFDSFEGLPDNAADTDKGIWQPGAYKAELETVRARFARAGIPAEQVTLVKGWFSDTLTPDTASHLGLRKAGVIMVDADMYSSSKEALDFCAPLIKDEAVIIFDDWYAGDGLLVAENMGQKRAFDEFLAENPMLKAEATASYSVFGRLAGQIFSITRVKISAALVALHEFAARVIGLEVFTLA